MRCSYEGSQVNYKQALSLGFELSSFFIISFLAHKSVAQYLDWDENITLALLMGLSLVIWTIHAFLYFESKSK